MKPSQSTWDLTFELLDGFIAAEGVKILTERVMRCRRSKKVFAEGIWMHGKLREIAMEAGYAT